MSICDIENWRNRLVPKDGSLYIHAVLKVAMGEHIKAILLTIDTVSVDTEEAVIGRDVLLGTRSRASVSAYRSAYRLMMASILIAIVYQKERLAAASL